MLKRLKVKRFRCLLDMDVPLRPLTVLIGPNDSGKTAFLESIEHLSRRKPRFDISDHWRWDAKSIISIGCQLVTASDEPDIWVEMSSDGKRVPSNEQMAFILPVEKYQLPARGIEVQCRGYAEGDEGDLPLSQDGTNVPAILDFFLRKDRKRFFQVVEVMREHIPGLQEIDIATPSPDARRIDFTIEDGLRIPAHLTSAGVRLLLFFVALAYHPSPPRTILLEEPEVGVHPKRLADVVGLLRAITEGKHGANAAQVILTTHSPYLLDSVDIERDQVLVFRRNDDGSRAAAPADADRLKHFLDEFMLGEIWFNQDEQGMVAKS